MIVAITPRQWSGLVQALAIGTAVTALEKTTGVSFAMEGARYIHRETLFQLVEAAVRRGDPRILAPRSTPPVFAGRVIKHSPGP